MERRDALPPIPHAAAQSERGDRILTSSPPPARTLPKAPIHPHYTPESSGENGEVFVPPAEPNRPVSSHPPPARPLPSIPLHPYHTPETSDETGEILYDTNPRTTTFDDSLERTSSLGRRKPVRPIPPPSPDGQTGSPEPSSLRSFLDLEPPVRDVVSPTPRRDTIHNIVDTYNRDSMMFSSTIDQHESEAFSDAEESDGQLVPPGPIFDLTPGREPSPARYKHGEPLHFGTSFV